MWSAGHASHASRRRVSRFAVNRAAGIVALLLFARQVGATTLIACEGHGSGGPVANSGAMKHGHASSHDRPVHSPAPTRDAGCDHSLAGTGCCVAASCTVTMTAESVLIVAAIPLRLNAMAAPAASFLSLDIAPAVPPPRS